MMPQAATFKMSAVDHSQGINIHTYYFILIIYLSHGFYF